MRLEPVMAKGLLEKKGILTSAVVREMPASLLPSVPVSSKVKESSENGVPPSVPVPAPDTKIVTTPACAVNAEHITPTMIAKAATIDLGFIETPTLPNATCTPPTTRSGTRPELETLTLR